MDLDVQELFGHHETRNEDDPVSEGEDQDDDQDTDDDGGQNNPEEEALEVPAPGAGGEAARKEIAVKPKRVLKNPRPKLDALKLMGPRGIPALQRIFKDAKWGGKGREHEDLKELLRRMQHWAHRLYPSMSFSDTLAQIEKLGTKKNVKVSIKKMRLDMFESDMNSNDVVDDVKRWGDDDEPEKEPEPVVDVFDELLGTSSNPPVNTTTTTLPHVSSQPSLELTDDQKERLRRNQLLAAERRMARLKRQREEDEAREEALREEEMEQNWRPEELFDKLKPRENAKEKQTGRSTAREDQDGDRRNMEDMDTDEPPITSQNSHKRLKPANGETDVEKAASEETDVPGRDGDARNHAPSKNSQSSNTQSKYSTTDLPASDSLAEDNRESITSSDDEEMVIDMTTEAAPTMDRSDTGNVVESGVAIDVQDEDVNSKDPETGDGMRTSETSREPEAGSQSESSNSEPATSIDVTSRGEDINQSEGEDVNQAGGEDTTADSNNQSGSENQKPPYTKSQSDVNKDAQTISSKSDEQNNFLSTNDRIGEEEEEGGKIQEEERGKERKGGGEEDKIKELESIDDIGGEEEEKAEELSKKDKNGREMEEENMQGLIVEDKSEKGGGKETKKTQEIPEKDKNEVEEEVKEANESGRKDGAIQDDPFEDDLCTEDLMKMLED